MTNINAALDSAQLGIIDKYVASKRQIVDEYEAFYKIIPDFEFFMDSPDTFQTIGLM